MEVLQKYGSTEETSCSAEEMQKTVGVFSDASKKFGLKINIKKTDMLNQPNTTRTQKEDIMVDGNKLNSILEFTYVGSTISSNGCSDDEIQRKVATTSASFGPQRQRLYLLIRKNPRWTGHLMRMSPDRLPKQVLYSQLSSGPRKRGRPRLRFKDTTKTNLTLRDIKTDSWTSLSQQRDQWRVIVK